MKRLLSGSVLALTLVGAGIANAAIPSSHPTMHPAAVHINYGARCRALADQWSSLSPSHSSVRHFSLARADAARGHRNCSATNVAQKKKGVGAYKAALKLIGVKPTH